MRGPQLVTLICYFTTINKFFFISRIKKKQPFFIMKKYIFSIILAMLTICSFAQTRTAVASGDWTDDNTWNPIGQPVSGEQIIIPSGMAVTIPNLSFVSLHTAPTQIQVSGQLIFGGYISGLDLRVGSIVTVCGVITTPDCDPVDYYISICYTTGNPPPTPTCQFTAAEICGFNAGGVCYQLSNTGGGPLPVEMVSFNGSLIDGQVFLSWQTASEKNNKGFAVQHSVDGIVWENLGFVKGNGTSSQINNYAYPDKTPFQGMNYYRLSQIDNDGKVTLSKIVPVELVSVSDLNVFPNPTTGTATLGFTSQSEESGVVHLTDITGRVVFKKDLAIEKGNNQISLDLYQLPTGIYFAQMQIENVTQTTRLVVAR